MKNYLKLLFISTFVVAATQSLSAQYYQIANQLTGLIQPGLSGSNSYKGSVEVSYLAGVGNKKADFLNISTSQGFQYRPWLYMGAGIGVDVAFAHQANDFGMNTGGNNSYWGHKYTKTGVMIPVFTDFRFNIGNALKPSFYVDLKIGASFLMGDSYLAVGNGFITNREYFYLKPSIGVRIPVSKNNGKQAVNIGVTYQLLTSNYWYYGSSSTTLNALGATASFEW